MNTHIGILYIYIYILMIAQIGGELERCVFLPSVPNRRIELSGRIELKQRISIWRGGQLWKINLPNMTDTYL